MNGPWIFLAAVLITLGLWRIAESIDGNNAQAICPGPLAATDYYTPEE